MRNIELCIAADVVDSNGKLLLSQNIQTAVEQGVKRIELCAAMHQEGLTPSKNAIQQAVLAAQGQADVSVMVRPKAGDFYITDKLRREMTATIHMVKDLGATGIVLGALGDDGAVDVPALREWMKLANALALTVTFHRAFDAAVNWRDTVAVLVQLGVSGILTSGTPWNSGRGAVEGLSKLVETAKMLPPHMQLIVGGSVSPSNCEYINATLQQYHNDVWLHAYSSVLHKDKICPFKTRQLTGLVQ